jgi:hypothetical protein
MIDTNWWSPWPCTLGANRTLSTRTPWSTYWKGAEVVEVARVDSGAELGDDRAADETGCSCDVRR